MDNEEIKENIEETVKNTEEQKKKSKPKKERARTHPVVFVLLGINIFLTFIITCIIALCAVLVMSYTGISLPTLNLGPTREDNVTIANEYRIESTTDISDAYLSGDTSALDSRQLETLNMASEVLDEITTDDMTPFEKEKAVYDWMCANINTDGTQLNVIPESEDDVDNPYGVLKYHTAVCVGYATTFRLFMQMENIPCMVVHNSENYHSWDLVQLDGEWYHTDVYSDSGIGDYSHFNMNDEMNYEDWDTDFFPAATGTKYNVMLMNAVDCSDVYEVPAIIREAMNKGDTSVAVKFSSYDIDTSVLDNLADTINSGLWNTRRYMNAWLSGSTYYLDDSIIYTVTIEYGIDDDGIASDTPQGEASQMENAVNDAFGDIDGFSADFSGYEDSIGDFAG